MKVLIIYGTTEGQTKKIAETASKHITAGHNQVDLIDSASLTALPDLSSYDALILAASVHQERHQDSIINLVLAQRERFTTLPTAFISVSLSAATADGLSAAEKYVDRFTWVTKFQPTKVLLLGGALQYSEYDYFKIEIVKHVVMKNSGTFEPTGNHEFTDWDALSKFLDEFLAQVQDQSK